jgi:cell fate (sporulation/competence/biofilm development) regulator YmcA (YheA/YmcA/DUF963 family)
MSKLNLKIDLNELGTAQREALAAFITAPRKYDEQHDEAMQEIKEDHVLEVKAEQEEAQPTEAPKRTRAKRTTSTTSDALADKERTESIVDEYNSKKEKAEEAAKYLADSLEPEEVEPEEVEPEAPEPEAAEPEAAEPEAAEPEVVEVTLDDLRALVTPLVLDNHRAELKAKIVELGGTKLADMPTENYGKLKTYLKGLK